MIRIFYRKPGWATWNHIDARDEAEAAKIRAALIERGYELK